MVTERVVFMKAFKFYRSKLISSLAGLLVFAVASPQAYCAEERVEKLVSLFNGGGYVSQSQVEALVADAKTSILKDEMLHRYYKVSFIAPSSQIKELRFGSHRGDAKSQEWTVGSLSAFFQILRWKAARDTIFLLKIWVSLKKCENPERQSEARLGLARLSCPRGLTSYRYPLLM